MSRKRRKPSRSANEMRETTAEAGSTGPAPASVAAVPVTGPKGKRGAYRPSPRSDADMLKFLGPEQQALLRKRMDLQRRAKSQRRLSLILLIIAVLGVAAALAYRWYCLSGIDCWEVLGTLPLALQGLF